MNILFLRATDLTTGSAIFRIASLFLHATLMMHVLLAAHARHLEFSNPGIASITLVAVLFLVALTRFATSNAPRYDAGWILTELATSVVLIAMLTTQRSMPALPLPWLIGVAGVFPLVLPARIGAAAIVLIASAVYALNAELGVPSGEWLPQVLATLFVGLLAVLLQRALDANFAAVQQARRNERRFDAIARAARHVFVIADASYRIRYINPAIQDVIGYTPQELQQGGIKPGTHPDDVVEHQQKLRYLRDTPRSQIFSRHRDRHKNGHWVWLETSGFNMLHDSAIDGLVFSIEDVTAHKDAELKLQEEHTLLRAVLDHNPSMIYAKDRAGNFTISNRSFQRRHGYASEEDVRGKTSHEVFLTRAADGREPDAYLNADKTHREDLQVIDTGGPLIDLETRATWERDRPRWYRTNKYPLHDAKGDVIGMLNITRDVTDRKEYELRLEYQALHDPLTGLPNRRYLLKKAAQAIADTGKTETQVAVLFCDLDFFKSVNDTHGHDFGDKCLMELTHRIVAALPANDFIARFGGNEFVILTHTTLLEAKQKADAILQTVSRQ